MEIPTTLLQRVLLDVGLQLSDSIDMDYREICSRYEHEGMSFLTITLPRLDDVLLQGLSTGRVTRSSFEGFRPLSRTGSLPALLSGFFLRVFNSDGSIRSEPDVRAIFAIRQVARLFKKVQLPCSEQRVKAAYERYISNDREVDWRVHRQPLDAGLWASICGFLWSDLEILSDKLYCSPGIFGIGATAEKKKRNERFSISEWPLRAEKSFPASYHAVVREDSDKLAQIIFLADDEERPVRVVQVPKTLKTPRTISVEPSYMMLMQQSIAKPLMVYLESKSFGFRSIRFMDQSINAGLARLGSEDGSLATIDLKDASDMVDNDLVISIFGGVAPTFLGLIQDCRSTRAKLPDGTIIPLKKFASMGSALCFPIESMVFFTIVMYTLVKGSGKVPSRHLLRTLAKDVAIYGDDIVVKSEMAQSVMDTLEDFGLRVNRDKSFHTGLFRESCGGDYYAGVNVTPTYVRHWDETGALRASSLKVAYVALSNTLYVKGLWHACQYIREQVDLRLKTRIPKSRHPIGVLHYISFVSSDSLSYDKRIHGYRVKGYRIRSQVEPDTPTDMDGFLSCAFQSRYFQEWLCTYQDTFGVEPLEEYLKMVRRGYDDDFRSTELDTYLYDSGIPGSSHCPPAGRERQSKSRNWDVQFHLHTEEVLYCLPYSDLLGTDSPEIHGGLLPWHRWSTRLERLEHLRISSSSVTTSDRPHALSLKRGWTASHAGLDW